MLSETGRLKGDLTVINWGDGTFWIEGSYYLRGWHMRWFADHAREGVDGPRHFRRRDRLLAFRPEIARAPGARDPSGRLERRPALHGGDGPRRRPHPREGRAPLGRRANSATRSTAARSKHAMLRRTLLAAGAELGVKEYGYNALLALRLEKSFGIWSAEFTQAYTPRMTGMDRWIAWDKGDFVGRKPALAERDGPASVAPARHARQSTRSTPTLRATSPSGATGAKVGFVTSGGYGHTIGKSLAMALVAPEAAAVGTELAVHIVGAERKARVIAPSPYDPGRQGDARMTLRPPGAWRSAVEAAPLGNVKATRGDWLDWRSERAGARGRRAGDGPRT